jgi:hypothetical protein
MVDYMSDMNHISDMSDLPAQTLLTRTDAIKRTTGPETTNGSQWEVQLSAEPPRAWLELFKLSGDTSVAAALGPRRVVFDRATAVFKSDEDHVRQWIGSIDKWIAWTEARYLRTLDEASRERSMRIDAEAKQRERIQLMNDRFKTL